MTACWANRKGNRQAFFIKFSPISDREVSRGVALRDMEVRPINLNVRNRSARDRSDHAPATEQRSGGKPQTVKHGDLTKTGNGAIQNPTDRPYWALRKESMKSWFIEEVKRGGWRYVRTWAWYWLWVKPLHISGLWPNPGLVEIEKFKAECRKRRSAE